MDDVGESEIEEVQEVKKPKKQVVQSLEMSDFEQDAEIMQPQKQASTRKSSD